MNKYAINLDSLLDKAVEEGCKEKNMEHERSTYSVSDKYPPKDIFKGYEYVDMDKFKLEQEHLYLEICRTYLKLYPQDACEYIDITDLLVESINSCDTNAYDIIKVVEDELLRTMSSIVGDIINLRVDYYNQISIDNNDVDYMDLAHI